MDRTMHQVLLVVEVRRATLDLRAGKLPAAPVGPLVAAGLRVVRLAAFDLQAG